MSTAFKRPATRKTYRTVDTLALILRNGSITGAMHDAGQQFSQPVFARYLNVSKNLVSDWERGVKKPGGPALRLLTVIQKKGLMAIA